MHVIPRKDRDHCRSLRSFGASPDFLWRPVTPMNCMRFSLKENRTRVTCQQREAGNPGPVGMTRRGWWPSGRVATWMDGIKSGYSAKNADSSGRDDKGRVASFLGSRLLEG